MIKREMGSVYIMKFLAFLLIGIQLWDKPINEFKYFRITLDFLEYLSSELYH